MSKLHNTPETIINRYFQYSEFIYNDGRGPVDTKIHEVTEAMFDDDLLFLAEKIVEGSARINERLIEFLPEYFQIERFY